jgi:hypothetical protein
MAAKIDVTKEMTTALWPRLPQKRCSFKKTTSFIGGKGINNQYFSMCKI